VGQQRFEIARPADIRAFAGTPNSIHYQNKLGEATGSKRAVWEIWTYRFGGGGYVYYGFHSAHGNWRFVEIQTNRQQFQTARGTRVGMSYAQAKQREDVPYTAGCIGSGFWHFRKGHRYAVIVSVNPGQSVSGLAAYGPSPLPC
jgi:hypothetical protein